MVLDNVSDSSSDDFSDSSPVSDSDPYSSSEPFKNTFAIDSSKFPQPVPVFGSLFGYNAAFLSKLVHLRVQYATKVLQRQPTEDEATALAYWTAKNMSLTSYGSPIGIAAGGWRAYNTASTFRFPFYQPDLESFTSLVWPSNRARLFSGSKAVLAWHATRLLAYGIVGNFLARIFFGSYAMSVSSVGEFTDPRLKSYVEDLRKASRNASGRLPGPPKPPGMAEGSPVQDDNGDDSANWRDNSTTDINTNTSKISAVVGSDNPEAHTQQMQRRPTRQSIPREDNAASIERNKQIQDLDDGFDDASTGGRRLENTGARGGSAWDRIRQQSSNQSVSNRGSSWPSEQRQQTSRPEQSVRRRSREISRQEKRKSQQDGQETSSTGDSFAFSKSEEDRQLAKEEAQKDFDARVEQERRGGEFSSGSV